MRTLDDADKRLLAAVRDWWRKELASYDSASDAENDLLEMVQEEATSLQRAD